MSRARGTGRTDETGRGEEPGRTEDAGRTRPGRTDGTSGGEDTGRPDGTGRNESTGRTGPGRTGSADGRGDTGLDGPGRTETGRGGEGVGRADGGTGAGGPLRAPRVRWVVVGAGGLLGREMTGFLGERGDDVVALPRRALDITDAGACAAVIRRGDVVVNAAAWTAADDAELDEDRAFTANAYGPAVLARTCAAAGARLVHVSTDYVFHEAPGGPHDAAPTPYAEDDLPRPRSAYGRTKAAGEWAVQALCPDHLIVRTAWLYGRYGACFPLSIVRRLREHGEVRVVDDQFGQPTWTRDVARLVVELVLAAAPSGTYHATAAGWTSWHAFARAVAAADGADPALVRPATTAGIGRRAPRPAFSALGHDAVHRVAAAGADVAPIGPWQERWSYASALVLGALGPGPERADAAH